MDTGNPVLMPWFDNVKSVLEMWFAGQEGGTATARVLLGLANPGGHSSLTWPKNATDTIWGYNEPAGALYPGSPGGRHPERLNGNGGCAVITGIRRDLRDRDRHDRDRGHLRGLPLLRQARHHAAGPVRLRPVLHLVRLLEPERRAEAGRDGRRRLRRHQHGFAGG